MPRVSTALHLSVAYDDITRHLAFDNDNYKFYACSYSVLQDFAFEIEVIVTSHSEVVRKLHVRCTSSSKFLKNVAFITDEFDIPWDPGISSTSSRDDSPLVAACTLLELSLFAVVSSRRSTPPLPSWFRYDSLVLML